MSLGIKKKGLHYKTKAEKRENETLLSRPYVVYTAKSLIHLTQQSTPYFLIHHSRLVPFIPMLCGAASFSD
jgi:hypothetical protein